ncbi:hypothetical protein C491_14992 [Natronococcus amylolyticus DSM 10524]|uniref:Uncharacterized protein n=1 Tax=Natronococcus amylolyticus DSM 10524 TaxID=1227497 RepID=L9X3B3_9EURY|nr:hypothetical protein C491_14992 [Natronococcus amylolyticus DSM 10524]
MKGPICLCEDITYGAIASITEELELIFGARIEVHTDRYSHIDLIILYGNQLSQVDLNIQDTFNKSTISVIGPVIRLPCT